MIAKASTIETIETQFSSQRQPYLKGNMFNKSDCQLLFKLRSKMLDVKTNFSNLYNKDLTYRTCKEAGVVKNESHLLQFKMLVGESPFPGDVEEEYLTV